MKVLFIPLPDGGAAHLIPLLALNGLLAGEPFETAFLAPRFMHDVLRQFGVRVLDVDHQIWTRGGFRTEMRAFSLFGPHVVVDDSSMVTAFTTKFAGLPRVALQRTGSFPGAEPRNKNHQHSMVQVDFTKLPDMTFMGLKQPTKLSDFFEASMHVVPGIRSIELLPPCIQNDPTYVFSGPLIIEDLMLEKIGWSKLMEEGGPSGMNVGEFRNFDTLRKFFDAHRGRKVVYATLGTMARPTPTLLECLKRLLDRGMAVVTSIAVNGLSDAQRELFYHAHYLPMHYVCSNADLMIHQCGSGTYHYPIIHGIPTITVGTGCYDREDVAARLEELGVSIHLPGPDECEDFAAAFERAVDRHFDASDPWPRAAREKIAALNAEIKQTAASFDFARVLRDAARH